MDLKRIHFIGVGGVGVNALAKLAIYEGVEVSGSDIKLNDLTGELVRLGARIWQGADASMLGEMDACVYSSAIKKDNIELTYLKKAGVRLYERKKYLYMQSRKFARVAAIAGTHGKTTTTAMLAHIMYLSKQKFVAMIGGESVDYGNYVNTLDGDMGEGTLAVEACEYRRSFLFLEPTVGVALNAECDHPDCYKDIEEVRQAFGCYLKKSKIKIVPESLLELAGAGSVDIAHSSSDDILGERVYILSGTQRDVYELRAGVDDVFKNGRRVGSLRLADPAPYNLQNALFAVAAADALGIDPAIAIEALGSFKGVKRRFERCGSISGVPVVFDFAHHPTEIACVLNRAAKFGRVLTVFQPHTFSRLKAYEEEFAKVFASIESDVILMPVYAARESSDMGSNSDELRAMIFDKFFKSNVYLANSTNEVLEYVKMLAKYHDIVLFVGAGDIYDLKKFFI